MYGSLTERITRSLAYMLRHQPEEFDLELDEQGFGDLEDIVYALNERLGEPIEEEDVVEAIGGGDRPRYEIVEGRIRALYGHSFPVDPGESSEPPEELFVGVSARDADRARTHGLHGGRRAFLHLARTFDEGLEMGRRAGPEYAVVTIHALDAWEEGIEFYDRRALFLAESIPTQFIEVGEVRTDGARREAREGREGRGYGGGRRGRQRDGERQREDWGRDRGGRRAGGRQPERAAGFQADPGGGRRAEWAPATGSLREEPPTASPTERPTERPTGRGERPERPAPPQAPRRERPAPQAAPQPTGPRDAGSGERAAPPERHEHPPSGASGADPGFGLGIFEVPSTPARRPPPPAPAPRAPRPEPEPEPEPQVEEGPASGFGAGLT